MARARSAAQRSIRLGRSRALNPLACVPRKRSPPTPTAAARAITPAKNQMKLRRQIPLQSKLHSGQFLFGTLDFAPRGSDITLIAIEDRQFDSHLGATLQSS